MMRDRKKQFDMEVDIVDLLSDERDELLSVDLEELDVEIDSFDDVDGLDFDDEL